MKRHRLAALTFACTLLVSVHAAAQQPAPDAGAPVVPPEPQQPQTPPENASGTGTPTAHETNCTDRRDDDADGLVDCGDADCMHTEACESGGAQENNDARCSDWIDNDGDGAIDCDDDDCQAANVTRCRGSWHGPADASPGTGGGGGAATGNDDFPELGANQSVEDLIGTHGDIDGERSDEVCADGIDNDGDGRTDCQDFGCRFDPSVTVCAPSPSIRFSVVAGVGASHTWDFDSGGHTLLDNSDVNFSRLQVRVLGPIPFVQNSFFLLSARLENTPRLTFAMFQIPIGSGHFLNVNSGSGGLSTELIQSYSKLVMLDPAYYVYNAFEQGNGAAVELGGPITTNGMLNYRIFAGGGSGQFNGNVGGRFFKADNTNFTYNAGAQLHLNIVGRYQRLDTEYLYTEVPTTVAVLLGAKWDQRAQERYIGWNALAILRTGRLLLKAETYGKAEFAYNYAAESFVVRAEVLLVPKLLLLAADVGGFYPIGTPHNADGTPPLMFGSGTIARPLSELQWRAVASVFFYRNVGMLSLIFTDHYIQSNTIDPGHMGDTTHEMILHLELQYRF